MPNMFAELAKKATTLSEIMEGREKISTKDVINTYPDGITIIDFDIITTTAQDGSQSSYPVIAFKENENQFVYGGKALMDIINLWIAHFDGDIKTCANALKAAGGVKVKMSVGQTRIGRTFTKIDVVG